MGLFNKNKKQEERKNQEILTNTFKMINGYCPSYTTYQGGLYEMGLTRTCIDKIAKQISKLEPVVSNGNKNYKKVETLLQNKPNRLMTTQQFLYRLATIFYVENNAYIVPIYSNKYATEVVGYYPVRSKGSRIVSEKGVDYLVYKIQDDSFAIEYDRVGILRRHYYKKEYFGESNQAFKSTMELIDTQEQGIKEGIKSGAMIRFLARLGIVQNPESIKAEQKRLKDDQLSIENNGGVLIFDNKYADVKQVDSKPTIVDKDQISIIKENVFDYFHISEEILQNKASEDQWNLFYEDVIEPFALQLGQVLTNMIIKQSDIEKGINIVLGNTKLYIGNNTKLQMCQLFDRGIFTLNQMLDVWGQPHIEDGDKRYIRKEYTEFNNLDKDVVNNENTQDSGKENSESTDEGNSNSEKESKE